MKKIVIYFGFVAMSSGVLMVGGMQVHGVNQGKGDQNDYIPVAEQILSLMESGPDVPDREIYHCEK